ncbi:MAG: hypothetical protein V7750_18110 [Sneathiella sp.]
MTLRKRNGYVLIRVYNADRNTPTIRGIPDPIALMQRGSLTIELENLIADVEPLSPLNTLIASASLPEKWKIV